MPNFRQLNLQEVDKVVLDLLRRLLTLESECLNFDFLEGWVAD